MRARLFTVRPAQLAEKRRRAIPQGLRMDSVQVRIYNDKNEVIRNLKWKADTGFNRWWWGMEERGYRSPAAPRPRPDAPETPGLQALPGTYKVVISLGRDADSTSVTIRDDPRLKKSQDVMLAQRRMLERLRVSSDKLIQAIDRLAESEETVGKITAQMRGLDGRDIDSLRKTSTVITDSIRAIREAISGRVSDRQGLSRPQQVTVLNTIQTAQQYITSKSLAPGGQEEALVKNAEVLIAQTLQRVNAFYNTKWKDYRSQTENTRIGLFKEYPPIQ